MFPHELVPDGSVWYPHHFLLGLIIVLFVVARLWDDYRTIEPIGVVGGCVMSLFGWFALWSHGATVPVYATYGALVTLVGLAVASIALIGRPTWWGKYPLSSRLLAAVGLLVAFDDVIEHAFGWPTPLDQLWNDVLVHNLGATVVGGLLLVIVAIVGLLAVDQRRG